MVRVCKQNHRVGIVDLLSPEDEKVAEIYNNLERLRDPSHTVALSKKQIEQILAEAGIAVEKIETRDVEVDFQRWVQMTGINSRTIQLLEEKLMADIDDGVKTGMRPFMQNGNLKFLQTWSVIIGAKRGE
jgi:hypothetical protein